jgi:hypothetical protein
MSEVVTVQFTSPHTSVATELDLSPEMTGSQVLAGAEQNGLLPKPQPGQPYGLVLQRTGAAITPNTSLQQAGVKTGDILTVTQAGQGA